MESNHHLGTSLHCSANWANPKFKGDWSFYNCKQIVRQQIGIPRTLLQPYQIVKLQIYQFSIRLSAVNYQYRSLIR